MGKGQESDADSYGVNIRTVCDQKYTLSLGESQIEQDVALDVLFQMATVKTSLNNAFTNSLSI